MLKGGFACVQKAYIGNIAFYTRRNALRVAEVWIDEYKTTRPGTSQWGMPPPFSRTRRRLNDI